MSWPIPAPADIAEQAAAAFGAQFPEADPRAPESVMAVIGRILGLTVYDAWLFQRALADELMPDTAIETLERHADIWGITRLPAASAGGPATFYGVAGTAIPAGTLLLDTTGAGFQVQELVTVGGGGSVVAQVLASTPGLAGMLAAGTTITLVSPIAGLTQQTAIVAAGGLTDPAGRDREDDAALRERLLRHIRARPQGGAAGDYTAWARTVPGVDRVRVEPGWVGAGSVGVIVAMAGGAVPTGGEVDLVAAAIDPLRPVTADVHVVPVELVEIDVEVGISPDTAQVRAAIAAALDLFFAGAAIGEPLYASRLSEAISAAGGEYAHELIAPAAITAIARQELPVLGALTFAADWP